MRAKRPDGLEQAIASRDDPNYYRTVYDAVNDRTVVLSDRCAVVCIWIWVLMGTYYVVWCAGLAQQQPPTGPKDRREDKFHTTSPPKKKPTNYLTPKPNVSTNQTGTWS